MTLGILVNWLAGALLAFTIFFYVVIYTIGLKRWTAQNIVIGHLNHPPVTTVYHDLIDLIHARNLRTVTLGDVFLEPEVTRLTSPYPS